MTAEQIPGTRARALLEFVSGSGGARHQRLATSVATVLILIDPSLRPLLDLLRSGAATVDGKMIVRMYWNSPASARVALASAPAARFVRASAFRRMWFDALGLASSASDKVGLALSLAGHLARHGLSARRFEKAILQQYVLVRRRDLRIRGYGLLGFWPRATPEVVKRFAVGLASRDPFVRTASLYGISVMATRSSNLPANDVSALLQLRDVVAGLRRDADSDVRMGARNTSAALQRVAQSVRVR